MYATSVPVDESREVVEELRLVETVKVCCVVDHAPTLTWGFESDGRGAERHAAVFEALRPRFSSKKLSRKDRGEAGASDGCSACDPCCQSNCAGNLSREIDTDLAELMNLFSSVSVSFTPNPCVGSSDDPCNINQLEWDGVIATDRYCQQTQPWVRTEFAEQVLRAATKLTQTSSD
jgi:hypothetical protein